METEVNLSHWNYEIHSLSSGGRLPRRRIPWIEQNTVYRGGVGLRRSGQGEIKRRQLKSRILKLPIPGNHVLRRKSSGSERGEEHCHPSLPYRWKDRDRV